MAKNDQETKAFMTAYNGLKSAAKVLESMSHETEPDLDRMLIEVKRAKQFYDQCNEVIENIKTQVESIFSGAVVTEPEFGRRSDDTDFGRQEAPVAAAPSRRVERPTPPADEDIPF